jgi:hypothetical protein
MTTLELQGQAPDPEQEQIVKDRADYWRTVSNEATVQAIARIEEAAKQLVNITGALQGLYFTVYAFSDVQEQVSGSGDGVFSIGVPLLFFLPVLFWLISLACAIQVFKPRKHPTNVNDVSKDAWQDVKREYASIREKKLTWLHRSHFWLICSFIMLFLLLVMLVVLPDAPPTNALEVIVLTPTPGVGP